ncbi:shavenoid isoform b [Holotrichia oblita]|uniref:Shavenoid isoform b n=1 Tax=Holotrichia oblita TaxID=644536 RepID=A0ACB9TJ10_HOLOL|nr:shavenoid isoform b [Holotrichia oblita]
MFPLIQFNLRKYTTNLVSGVATPICAVSGAKFLTEIGWVDLRNPMETDVPFRLYRDEGRTFLQWEGESILRNRMTGRMVLVHLKCKDLDTGTDPEQELEAEFSPCVAFRVVGTPLKYPNKQADNHGNVYLVESIDHNAIILPPDVQTSNTSSKNERELSENFVFAFASILLGVIYGAAAFLYLNLRKKRKHADVKLDLEIKPNLSSLERGIMKNNPLVKLETSYLSPNRNFRNDEESKNDLLDSLQRQNDDEYDEAHRYANYIYEPINPPNYPQHYDYSAVTFEKLPEEGVSIVETLDENKDPIKNAPNCMSIKMKLYFNLEYFEPELLKNPPKQAVEFLIKIKDIIRSAKAKISANKFLPNLLDIPEENETIMKTKLECHLDYKDLQNVDYLALWEKLSKLGQASRISKRKPVMKPNCPPPPIPIKLENDYDDVSKVSLTKQIIKEFSRRTESVENQPPTLRRALPMNEEVTVVNPTINMEAQKVDNNTLIRLLQRGNLLNEVYINTEYSLGSSSSSKYSNTSVKESQPFKISDDNIDTNFNRRFGSLREIYLAKIKQRSMLNNIINCGGENVKNLTSSSPVYDEPKPPRIVSESKPPLPPKKFKQKPDHQNSSDYEPIGQDLDQNLLEYSTRFQTDINNQFILQTQSVTPIPNLSRTVFKQSFNKNAKFMDLLGKYLQKPEDSDYISTDSEDSCRNSYYKHQILRRRCSIGFSSSETDESPGDERSDSDIESIEAGSFLFQNLQKYRIANPLDVSEVVFSADAQSSDSSEGNGLSMSEIVAIGICSVLLGLIYVASVFLYIHMKKRRQYNDTKLEIRDNPSLSNVEEGIVKNNPLLGLGRHFTPQDNNFSDTTGSDTDVTPDILQHQDDRKKNIQLTSALVHPYRHEIYASLNLIDTFHHQDSSTIERLPEENVSIIETPDGREDRPENVKAIGTTRKKLYFNPAYFEPHLLQTPPPAAIEFLSKIREVITIAKQKMATKRFSPSLMGIPEEDTHHSHESTNDYSQSFNSRRGSIISLKRENSRRKFCAGCPDCQPKDFRSLCGRLPEFPTLVACESCSTTTESKQHSIRKWLEDIPVIKPNNGLRSPPPVPSPKRMRSPTRSLPPNYVSSPIQSLSPKAASDRVKTRKSEGRKCNQNGRRMMRKPIVKPNCPPPPLPVKLENHYDTVPNISPEPKSLPPPDMIHEAMVVDEETRVPTITKKKMNAVIDEFARNVSESKAQIDYETDSLERSCQNKGFSTPTEYAEVSSSQPSPSLSTALPMDEEMTMGNAIINAKTGNMTISKLNMKMLQPEEHDYELIVLKKSENSSFTLPELLHRGNLVSEVYVNNGYNYNSAASSSISSNSSTLESKPPKVRYDNNKPGHLLIEVEDCPDNYIRIEDSDDFEPDTLDRKPKINIKKDINIESDDYSDSLERPNQIFLRSTGSFKTHSLNFPINQTTNFNRNFGSLREIYQAKTRQSIQNNFKNKESADTTTWKDGIIQDSEGKLLTLEERHSKRQRRSTTPSISGVPPDVIPPNTHEVGSIYEQPKPPRKVIDSKPPLPPKGLKKKNPKDQQKEQKDNNSISSSSSSDYEPIMSDSSQNTKAYNASILKNLIRSDDIFFKNGINNQFILQAQTITPIPNLSRTIFRRSFNQNAKVVSILGKYLQKPEDSGYLSTDSEDFKKKKCNKDQTNQCSFGTGPGSETDESLCDGHSESGAESVETHSVFFDSFRKPCLAGSLDSGVDADLKLNSFTNVYLDDGASSDSENVSFKTVVNNRRH